MSNEEFLEALSDDPVFLQRVYACYKFCEGTEDEYLEPLGEKAAYYINMVEGMEQMAPQEWERGE